MQDAATRITTDDGYLGMLRRNRDFRLLYVATLISLAGDWFATVALLDLVLELTGSATLAALVVVGQTLPVFFTSPLAGPLIDRVDRRRLMVLVDLVRSVAALLPILAFRPGLLPVLYLGVVLVAIGGACYDPAATAALPNLVEQKDLGRANVLIGSTWGTMLMVGSALGGLVTMKLGRNAAFLIDGLSFLVAALLVARIRAPFSEKRAEGHRAAPLLESLREAIRYARERPRVLALLVSKGGYGLGAGVVASLGLFGKEVFHAGATGIGVLFCGRGIGALCGPFLMRGLVRDPNRQIRLIAACIFLFGLGYIGLAFAPSLALGTLAVMVAHLGGGAQWQTSTYHLQREVPDSIRGRIFAADFGLVTLTMSGSSLASGLLADRLGAVRATAITASLCLLWAVCWGGLTYRLWQGRATG